MNNNKAGSKTPKGRDRKEAPAQSTQKTRAKGSRSPDRGGSRQGNASSKRQDDKSSRSWRNTSPDGSWRDTETPRALETPKAQEKPGDMKILKKDRGRDDSQPSSTSSAWRPKAHSPETMWRPASASTQASSKEDDDDLQTNFRKYLNGYRNKSPDSIIDDDGDGEEDLSAAQRQWLLDRSKQR
jgi:hypothetical protein